MTKISETHYITKKGQIKRNPIRKLDFQRTNEFYAYCPYCENTIQYWHEHPNQGDIIVCKNCGKKFEFGEVHD